MRPVTPGYNGHVIVPVFSGKEVNREYLLPSIPHCFHVTFLLTDPHLMVSIYSVQSECIVYTDLPASPTWSRLFGDTPGTIIRVFGVDQLWYVESNVLLSGL